MGIPSGSRILSERMRSEVQVPEPLSPKGRATRMRKLAPEGQKSLSSIITPPPLLAVKITHFQIHIFTLFRSLFIL